MFETRVWLEEEYGTYRLMQELLCPFSKTVVSAFKPMQAVLPVLRRKYRPL